MGRSVVAVERSPLARNIYLMMFSQLDEISLIPAGGEEPISDIFEKAKKSNV